SNPCLEEGILEEELQPPLPPTNHLKGMVQDDLTDKIIARDVSLQEMLLRQLGMFANSDEELRIGHEIIGNIDENGYLKASLDEVASALSLPIDEIRKVLTLIQQFEPAGVGCQSISECLSIQLTKNNETDSLIFKIAETCLEDIAKKNYSLIARKLKEPLEKIEPLIKKILKLDPKPGRNYSAQVSLRIIPDITVKEKNEALEVIINNEHFPVINISNAYKQMLKKDNLDPAAREFIENKMRAAQELLRSMSKRTSTLRTVVEKLVGIQQDAIREDLSFLKPLTFAELAKELDIHETTVCRTVMNKYIDTPCGIVALKDLFSAKINDGNGQAVSVNYIKKSIKELIEREDKKHPLSDEEIAKLLLERFNLKAARRTVAKYRDEFKIPSTTFRRIR
ncbi:MAG: RNA polymerase factor sigma-54, partial [Candidatus Omnitrophica bacterium]|nr:RNA polymerase factor sigma-54 [Candidatus Omnitrophota bacterium]